MSTSTPIAREITYCRSCGSGALLNLHHFGSVTLSDFLQPWEPDPPTVPLDLVQCCQCLLVQLAHTTDPHWLYGRGPYWYRSGVNEVMRAELRDIVDDVERLVGSVEKRIVIDVGANDGTLLKGYPGNTTTVAFEPVPQFADTLRAVSDLVVSGYFPHDVHQAGLPRRSVTAITAIACFYDLDRPREFVATVDDLLTDDGVWIVQLQDLASMVATTGYDNLCPEHLTYWSVPAFEDMLGAYDLQLVRWQRRTINGGSLRLVVRRRGFSSWRHQVADDQQVWEQAMTTTGALQDFIWQTQQAQTQLRAAVERTLAQHGTIDLYAASTKSSILLQLCNLTSHEIRCAVERSPEKVGRVTSGTRIPIVAEETWRQDPAAVTLIGAWGFRDAFLQREATYLADGGTFLVPLPRVEIVQAAPRALAV